MARMGRPARIAGFCMESSDDWDGFRSLDPSWPGLSRPPRLFLRCASNLGVAGTSPATTPVCDSKWFNMTGIRSSARYIELQCTSYFSFLRGASSCDELFDQAAKLGIEALAIVDRNSLAGIVRAHEAARTAGVRLIVGCRLDLHDGPSVLVYPTDRPAYARLCRLLSLGKKRGGKAKCHLHWSDLAASNEGLIGILVPIDADETCALHLRRMREVFVDRAYLALTLRRRPNDQLRLHE